MPRPSVEPILLRLLPLFLLAVVLANCDAIGAASAPPQAVPTTAPTQVSERGSGDTLKLILWQAPATLNPYLSTAVKDWVAARITLEPLASFDQDGLTLIPFLAAEIPSRENGGLAADSSSVTWRLKPDVQWSDGTPFTAEDVKFTYRFISEYATSFRNAYTSVASVEVIDPLTVRVNFKQPTPAWSLPFVGSQGMILPQHIFQIYNGTNFSPNREPPGTGPYRVVSFEDEDQLIIGNDVVPTIKVVYEPNPFFREADRPFFRRVELQGGADAGVAARAVLQNGVTDYAWNTQVDGPTLEQLAGMGHGQVLANLGSNVERLILNRSDPNIATADGERSSLRLPHPFFSDERVRRAFAYAIDRNAIVKLYPKSQLTSNLLVAPLYYSSPNTSFEFNLDKARALLDEAGWTDSDGDGVRDKGGVAMRVQINTTLNPVRKRTLDIVAQALEQIGVVVEVKSIDVGKFTSTDPAELDSWTHFYADMQEFFHGNQSPDPGEYMGWWTTAQIPQKANGWQGFNFQRWSNPEYDALYAQSASEIDPEQRRQLFIKMNDLIINDVVLIPLVHRAQLSAVGNTLEGVRLTPWDADTWNIKDWRRRSP
ncbi:MAG: peptide ABC transporter substrate-binding protein [Roseiflexaceae bacterium]